MGKIQILLSLPSLFISLAMVFISFRFDKSTSQLWNWERYLCAAVPIVSVGVHGKWVLSRLFRTKKPLSEKLLDGMDGMVVEGSERGTYLSHLSYLCLAHAANGVMMVSFCLIRVLYHLSDSESVTGAATEPAKVAASTAGIGLEWTVTWMIIAALHFVQVPLCMIVCTEVGGGFCEVLDDICDLVEQGGEVEEV